MPHDPKLVAGMAQHMASAAMAHVASQLPAEYASQLAADPSEWVKEATAALDAIEAAGWAVMGPKHVAQIDEIQGIMNEIKAAGWVLVPPEPTLAMTFAGQEALLPDHPAMPGPATAQVTTGSFDKIYRAMVAARPGAHP